MILAWIGFGWIVLSLAAALLGGPALSLCERRDAERRGR